MYVSHITSRGNIPVLEKLMAFTEARQSLLAENIANIDNPGYKSKRLDARLFQESLRRAVDGRRRDPEAGFRFPVSAQSREDDSGRLQVVPAEEPASNILFHDRSNARLESLMTQIAENVMTYQVASRLLQGQFAALEAAIRGQV